MVNALRAINSDHHYVRIHLPTTSNRSIDEAHAIVDSDFTL